MSIALYMDVHVPAAITRSLMARGVDVITSQTDVTTRLTDSLLLDRARELNRVIFTRDEDFLVEAAGRSVCRHQLRVTIGQCVQDLETIAKCGDPSDLANRVKHLPLR